MLTCYIPPIFEGGKCGRSDFPITPVLMKSSEELCYGEEAALVLDGFHLNRVLMDCRSSFNLLYADTVRDMHINPARIRPSEIMIKGFTPGVWTQSIGNITLEVLFCTPEIFVGKA